MTIILYTRDGCSLCEDAKVFLKENNLPFFELHLEKDISRAKLLEMYPEADKLPVVIIDDRYIGGKFDLVNYVKTILHTHEP